MDISTLTNLITAFRTETRQDSITPDSLGQLLQKIVNVLEQASDTSTLQQIVQWKNLVTAIGSVLKSISLGSDDRNNVYLNIESINTTNGMGQVSIFTIRQATTERAGAMRAQQVTDLNSVRNKMNHVAGLELKVEASASSVQVALHDKYSDVFNDPSLLQKQLPLASSSQAGVLSAADYKRFSEASQEVPASAHPFYHIECDSKGKELQVKFPAQLISDGYVPYLLRYSRKRPRYRPANDRQGQRYYGPVKRGWHLFYDEKKIKVSLSGEVQFGYNTGTDRVPNWEYDSDIRHVFGNIRAVNTAVGLGKKLVGYKIGFGCKSYLIKTNHRFRFGIVFAPPITAKGSRSLDFSKAVSNIAEFYVHFRMTDEYSSKWDSYYDISYSI